MVVRGLDDLDAQADLHPPRLAVQTLEQLEFTLDVLQPLLGALLAHDQVIIRPVSGKN
jgi:hypothetical protein